MHALLLENIHPHAKESLNRHGIGLTVMNGSLSQDELIAALDGVQVLGIRSRTRVSERVLQNASSLLALGCFCIGTNQIDLTAASLNGVPVFNAPYSNTRSVAEIVIAEIILLFRRLYDKIVCAQQGIWEKVRHTGS